MKKIIFLLLCFTFLNNVCAEELQDITENTKVMYRWYKEEKIAGIYYPKKDELEGYYEDTSDFIYGNYTVWDEKYCSYSKQNYNIEYQDRKIYRMVEDSRYVKISNLSKSDIENIKIFFGKKLLDFELVEESTNSIKLDLKKSYDTSKLWFYINVDTDYEITLSNYEQFVFFTISKKITGNKILIPDKTWITSKTGYVTFTTTENKEINDFVEQVQAIIVCRAREIKTYRYKLNKIYYDNNYHDYIEGYKPDINNYLVKYTEELPTETIEITKTVKEIEKEYIYIENNVTNQEEDSSDENQISTGENQQVPNANIQTKYIEKEVIKEKNKIPKLVYILIIILISIILILIKKSPKKSIEIFN